MTGSLILNVNPFSEIKLICNLRSIKRLCGQHITRLYNLGIIFLAKTIIVGKEKVHMLWLSMSIFPYSAI